MYLGTEQWCNESCWQWGARKEKKEKKMLIETTLSSQYPYPAQLLKIKNIMLISNLSA
jgi:hypothetical protein